MSVAKAKKNEVTVEQIIVVWEESDTAEEAAEKLGLTRANLDQRVRGYRKAGVELKKMPTRKPLDVAGLNKMIRELRAKQNYGDDGK